MSKNPVAELLFSEADATPISTDPATVKSWDLARTCVESAHRAWLSTGRPAGGPHAVPLMPVWVDGAPCFTSRPHSRKSRNLAGDPRCVLTAADETLDLVIEGEAVRITDENGIRRVLDAFGAKYGWGLSVRDGSAFADDLPGSPEYGVYRIVPTRAFGYGADGSTATRWRFEGE
ncbi:pyridoxamine 5'-phosphate oxidase family protein [Streptosporangium sp. NPDC001559]|uniref:pyridoxamine 5'-phosphate oxidase family protein n=1 Tax=Streptosporangium sp. NPDC001559 TaxID=3366187 RepID=UPI0036E6F582